MLKFTCPIFFSFLLFFNATTCFSQQDNTAKDTIYWQQHVQKLNEQTEELYIEGKYLAAEHINDIAYQEAQYYLNKLSTAYLTAAYNSAIFLDRAGKHEEAIKLYLEVKDAEEILKVDNNQLSLTCNGLGLAYELLGDYYNALNYLEKAIQLRQKASSKNAILGTFISDKALCLEYLGELDKAKKANQTCLQTINELKTTEKETDFTQQVVLYCYQNLASIALKENDNLEVVESLLQQSEKIIKSKKISQKISYTYELWGNLKTREKDYATAHIHYDTAIVLLKKELEGRTKDVRLAQLCTQKSIAYRQEKELKKALKCHQKALNAIILDKSLDINGFDNPSKDQFINQLHAVEVLAVKAITLEQMQHLEAAYETYLLATDLIPDTRRSYKEQGSKYHLARTTIGIYEAAIGVAFQLFEQTKDRKYQEQAFAFSESNKAVLLLEDMQRTMANSLVVDPTLDSLLKEEEKARYAINGLERQLVQLNNQARPINIKAIEKVKNELLATKEFYYNDLQTTLKAYPQYWSFRYNFPPISVDNIRQSILTDDDMALIEFFVGADMLYLFFITQDQFEIQQIPKTAEYETAIQMLRPMGILPDSESGFTKQYQNFLQYSTDLYDLLFAKILDKASHLSRLLIIPDGDLYNISMDILLKKRPTTDDINYGISNQAYLFEDFALSYHYSTQLFLFHQGAKENTGAFVGFVPSFDKHHSLLATPIEVNEIADSYSDIKDTIIFRKQEVIIDTFQKYAFLASILHLATHAEAGDGENQIPQIYLSDTILTYYDLEQISFNTDLVVLSACETGNGEIIEGEGAMTLARSIIRAGSSSVLATSWSISDSETKDIMIYFYKNLQKGWTKDKALQAAKIQYLQNPLILNQANPFYWAAFQQYGDSQAMKQPKKNYIFWFVLIGLMVSIWGLVKRKERSNKKDSFSYEKTNY